MLLDLKPSHDESAGASRRPPVDPPWIVPRAKLANRLELGSHAAALRARPAVENLNFGGQFLRKIVLGNQPFREDLHAISARDFPDRVERTARPGERHGDWPELELPARCDLKLLPEFQRFLDSFAAKIADPDPRLGRARNDRAKYPAQRRRSGVLGSEHNFKGHITAGDLWCQLRYRQVAAVTA